MRTLPPSAPVASPPRTHSPPTLGASAAREGTTFTLWSTRAERAAVVLFHDDGVTRVQTLPLERDRANAGLFTATFRDVRPGALYKFEINGDAYPDPYARYLPFGVHGPARVEAPATASPLGRGLTLEREIVYELHVGAFTAEGTFRAAIEKLDALATLGITALELMPISAFDGARGWGYDGVAHYAPFAGYGTPADLRALVDAAHARGMGMILDVVYNHFGPSGNYLGAYSPEYFTAAHRTPWGDAPDFANPYLRKYVLDNVRYWLVEFGFDGLRLDATHGILDDHSPHVLREIANLAHGLTPRRLVLAEDERNDPRLVTEQRLDGVWADDFHHAVRVTLTGERDGYYRAYEPGAAGIAKTIERGWLFEGQENPLTNKPRGAPADALAAASFLYCIQNHDQVGNRAFGSRLNHDASPEAYAAASMLLLFLPQTPILFMGQEWGATSPFLYFTDHASELGERVSKGRQEEFEHFADFGGEEGAKSVPDPQADETFARSKLPWSERERPEHASIVALYTEMLALRRDDAVLRDPASARRSSNWSFKATAIDGDVLRVRRARGDAGRTLYVNLGKVAVTIAELTEGSAEVLCASRPNALADGVLAAESAVLVAR